MGATWSVPASCLWRHAALTVHKKAAGPETATAFQGKAFLFSTQEFFRPATGTRPLASNISDKCLCASPKQLGGAYYRSAISWLAGQQSPHPQYRARSVMQEIPA